MCVEIHQRNYIVCHLEEYNMMKLEEVIGLIKHDPMMEKVINTLSSILNDSTLKKESFNIIPTLKDELDCNRSPVHYAEEENCIGLESWCLKHLYKYCQDWVITLNKATFERKKSVNARILSKQKTNNFAREYMDIMNKYLTIALLINADAHTFWNIKRTFIVDMQEQSNQYEKNIIGEMEFTNLILSHKPTSMQTYSYRAWLIDRWRDGIIREKYLLEEIRLTDKLVLASANNYHGWNHRIWCIEFFRNSSHFAIETKTMVNKELQFTYDYINQHVSDHSGFHYRQYILANFQSYVPCWHTGNNPHVLDFILGKFQIREGIKNAKGRDKFVLYLCELLECCNQLNQHFPSHEAIWYHRRFVFGGIVIALHENEGIELNSFGNDHKLITSDNSLLYKYVLWLESKYIKKLSENNANYSWDMICLERYRKWLKYTFHIDLDQAIDFENTEIIKNLLVQ